MRKCAFLALAILATMVGGQSQEKDVRDILDLSREELKKKKDPQRAALLLRNAFPALHRVKNKEVRKALLVEIRKLLREADPLERRREMFERKAANGMIKLALSYAKKNRFGMARDLLHRAVNLCPELEEKIPTGLKKALLEAPESSAIKEFFQGGLEIGEIHGWMVGDDLATSPVGDGKGNSALISKKWIHGRKRISFELRIINGPAMAGFIFRRVRPRDYYWLIFGKEGDVYTLGFFLGRAGQANQIYYDKIPDAYGVKEGWNKITVELLGHRISIGLNGSPPYKFTLKNNEDTDGAIGFLLGRQEKAGAQLQVRNLKIEDL